MSDLHACVALLREGKIVACPTETWMGLLADALNPAAVTRVCQLKQRPAHEPVALLVPSLKAAVAIARDPSALAVQLASIHWPGPLTLVMNASPHLPPELRQDGKVGMRVPGPSPALDLVTAFGGPLTATSANLSGATPTRTAAEVRGIFGDDVAAVLAGESPGGLPSTVVDVTGESPIVIRQGAIRF